MKHRRQDTGGGVSSSRSNILRAMRGRIPKVPNFPALGNQRNTDGADSQSKLVLPQLSASSSALQQVAPAAPITRSNRASDRNGPSFSYYGFEFIIGIDDSSTARTTTKGGRHRNFSTPTRIRSWNSSNKDDPAPRGNKHFSRHWRSITFRPASLATSWPADPDPRWRRSFNVGLWSRKPGELWLKLKKYYLNFVKILLNS